MHKTFRTTSVSILAGQSSMLFNYVILLWHQKAQRIQLRHKRMRKEVNMGNSLAS